VKRLLHVAALTTTVIAYAPLSAETRYTCGHATVRSVQAVTETITRNVVTTRRSEEGDIDTIVEQISEARRRSYVLTVGLRDRLYTSASTGDPYGTLDPLQLAAGDPIDVCVDDVQMIVERPDGTDYRAAIVPAANADRARLP
jgi:hypothetical protein